MKHLLITCSLLAISVMLPSYAQEDDAAQQDTTIEVARNLDGGIKIDISGDSDVGADEKINKVTDLISQFDSEIGNELKSELSSLSDEDKAELVKKLDEGFVFEGGDFKQMPFEVALIAFPAVILIFGMPLFLLLALLGAGHRKRKQKMELVELYVKNQKDIPEHVVTALDSGGSASSLKSGLTLTAIGLGIVVTFEEMGAHEIIGFGLIPMFLGVARLIFWFVVERKTEPEDQSESEL